MTDEILLEFLNKAGCPKDLILGVMNLSQTGRKNFLERLLYKIRWVVSQFESPHNKKHHPETPCWRTIGGFYCEECEWPSILKDQKFSQLIAENDQTKIQRE